ncbi:phosphatase PAP2 family protein [Bosea beijingensis]|uniref:phosphatase PAP2 family protein n=1 Tax=Bosea beijingensis TaxID=3068632 RepID=UPI002741F1BC|nr:phosphatase PAP2 family protein [Bosea sp. REN20]
MLKSVAHAYALSVARRSNAATWALLMSAGVVCAIWVALSPLSLVKAPLIIPVGIAACLALLGWFYRTVRGDMRLSDALDVTAQLIGFLILAGVFSYLVATLNFPLQDQLLYAADRALGLDWQLYLRFVNDLPWLGRLLHWAYLSFLPQIVILALALGFSGRGEAARIMVLAMIATGIVTILISGFMPAVAMFAHLGLKPEDYPNLTPAASFVHLRDLEALRSGAPFILDVSRMEGIVTFPSFHAAVALLLLLGAWAHPWLRWPFLAVNLAMIAATPIDGGHYFVDVLAGLGLAALCHVVAGRFIAPVTRRAKSPQVAAAIQPAT